MKKKPQQKKIQKTTQSSTKVDLEKYFEAKLAAEWGPHDLKRRLDEENIVVLDVRDKESYQEQHIPTAINIPYEELEARWKELPKNKEIIAYCWTITCSLALRAALLLAKKNFRVKELVGGIREWKHSNFPIEGKEELVAAGASSCGEDSCCND